VASLIAPSTYSLTHLLRARYGTELAMGAASGSPFVFLGQASPPTDRIMETFLDVGTKLFSPVDITVYEDTHDVVFEWVRRSRIPSIELDDWGDNFAAPLDSIDERYDVDVLSGPGGAVKRTLHAIGSPRVTYTEAEHLVDWGSLQASLTVRVYQVDQIVGRGHHREATLQISYDTAFDTLYDDHGEVLRDENGNALI
jgi:hypothetical protein